MTQTRFKDLAVGSSFLFDGETYTKIEPISLNPVWVEANATLYHDNAAYITIDDEDTVIPVE